MRLMTSLLRGCVVMVLFAALVFAGSAGVREGRGHRSDDGGSALGVQGQAAARVPAGVVDGDAEPMPTGGTAMTMTPGCSATSVLPKTADLARSMQALDLSTWHSADGGVSAPLGDGRVVWLFGDTRQAATGGRPSMVSNSMLVSSGGCFAQAVAPGDGALIGSADTDLTIWPTAVASVDHGSWTELLVFSGNVRRAHGFWSFTLLGTTLTRFAVPDGGAPRRLDTRQVTSDDVGDRDVTWGTAAVASGGWLYVYGTRVTGSSLGREVYAARTRMTSAADAGAWQFWGAHGWGAASSSGALVPVLSAQPGASHIISVLQRSGAWYVVSKAGGDLGDDIGIWRAAGPQGPFRLVERVPRAYALTGHQVRYMPLAHPELTRGRDVIVSMSRNVTQGSDVARNPQLGRPEFFTLTLPPAGGRG